MPDLSDVIQETLDQSPASKINSRVALFVAITATFMALCNVKDGNVVQAMSQAQANALNSWSYFEAKSTKQAVTEKSLEMLKVENKPEAQALIKTYGEQVARYDKEKAEIKAQAEGYEKQYNDINLFDDQFDMTDALLTIAIAMLGITSLTQQKWLLYFSGAASLLGILLGLAAFLHIPLHSNFISSILG